MFKQLLFIGCMILGGGLFAQCTPANWTSVPNLSANSFPYTSPSSGVVVTATTSGVPTLGNVSYTCAGQSYACASPAWWINSSSGVITLGFSCPISSFTVVINGTNLGEIMTFTGNAGTTTLSNYCTAGFSTVAPNQLIDNISSATGTIITVNNVAGATQYQITHNGTGSGSRITLLDCFVCANPFDAETNDFQAEYRSDLEDVKLTWDTQAEMNLKGFEVEHSRNGAEWEMLGFVEAKALQNQGSSYDFLHLAPQFGDNFYRLRKVDQDASYSYSEVKRVNILGQSENALVFPNPSSGVFEIQAIGRNGQLEVLDMLGKVILSQPFDEMTVLDLHAQPKGTYLLRITDQSERKSNQRIVIQ